MCKGRGDVAIVWPFIHPMFNVSTKIKTDMDKTG
jgi:hypothetical protein